MNKTSTCDRGSERKEITIIYHSFEISFNGKFLL